MESLDITQVSDNQTLISPYQSFIIESLWSVLITTVNSHKTSNV